MNTEPTHESRKRADPARGTGANPATEAARFAMRRAGSVVIGAAANKARSGVESVAGRLDRVATGATASGGGAAAGLATTATRAKGAATGVTDVVTSAADTAKRAATTVATAVTPILRGVGAGFSLVVYKIIAFLRFLRRLALQLLEALRKLTLALRQAAARRRGGGQEAVDHEAAEGAGDVADQPDQREPTSRPEPRREPGGMRPRRPVRPRRGVTEPERDAPAPIRRAPRRPGRT